MLASNQSARVSCVVVLLSLEYGQRIWRTTPAHTHGMMLLCESFADEIPPSPVLDMMMSEPDCLLTSSQRYIELASTTADLRALLLYMYRTSTLYLLYAARVCVGVWYVVCSALSCVAVLFVLVQPVSAFDAHGHTLTQGASA